MISCEFVLLRTTTGRTVGRVLDMPVRIALILSRVRDRKLNLGV